MCADRSLLGPCRGRAHASVSWLVIKTHPQGGGRRSWVFCLFICQPSMGDDEHRLYCAQWISRVWDWLSLFVKVCRCEKGKLGKQEGRDPWWILSLRQLYTPHVVLLKGLVHLGYKNTYSHRILMLSKTYRVLRLISPWRAEQFLENIAIFLTDFWDLDL